MTILKNTLELYTFLIILAFHYPLMAVENNELELKKYLSQAINSSLEWHPSLKQQKAIIAEASAEHANLLGFYDAVATANAGYGDQVRNIPTASTTYGMVDEAFTVNGGVRVPVKKGVYLDAGLSHSYYNEYSGYDNLSQTTFGIQLEVPLLRDKNFALFSLEEQMALFKIDRYRADLLSEIQGLHLKILQSFIAIQEKYGLWQERIAATKRVQKLLDETRIREKEGDTALFQIYQAELEVGLRKEEELSAKADYRVSLNTLATLLPENSEMPSEELVSGIIDSSAKYLASLSEPKNFMDKKGEIQSLQARLKELETENNIYHEQKRGELNLIAATSWQAESEDELWGTGSALNDHTMGASIKVQYTKPMGDVSANARLYANRSRQKLLNEQLRQKIIELQSEIKKYHIQFANVSTRMDLIQKAIISAETNLHKQEERFQLGEGNNKNVLDAQKDLTDARRRQIAIAAELLTIRAQHAFTISDFSMFLNNIKKENSDE